MKKSDKLARKTRKMIAKNLIVLAVLATVAFAGVVSWFTQNTTAPADGISVTTEVPAGLEIAIVDPSLTGNDLETYLSDDSNWHTGTVSLNSNDYPFFEGLFLCEVTSDGKNFVSPVLTQADGVASVDNSATALQNWGSALPNEDYLSFDLYMRCNVSKTIYLDSSTSVAPKTTLVSGGEGVFSKDTAVGAARFSVIDTGNNITLLWIPAPNVYFYVDNNGDSHVITGLTDNTYNTYVHKYYTISGEQGTSSSNVVANNAGNYQLGKVNNNNFALSTLSSTSNGYYQNHVRCNLWLEGEDSEARLALVGGKFKVTLKLTFYQ